MNYTPKSEEPIPVREVGDGFVIDMQTDIENLPESNLPGESMKGEKGDDDSYKSGTSDKDEPADKSGIADKSKAEELIENIHQNMLEGDIQSEVVMDKTEFEDYLVN